MLKSASLQAALYAAPVFRRHVASNPANLMLVVRDGAVRATGARGLSFEYAYDLVVGVFDFPGHTDEVMIPILCWAAEHQRELLTAPSAQARGIAYEAEVIDDKTYDLYITLPLTERVRFALRPDGGYDVVHMDDLPFLDEEIGASPLHRLFCNDELIATCAHPVA